MRRSQSGANRSVSGRRDTRLMARRRRGRDRAYEQGRRLGRSVRLERKILGLSRADASRRAGVALSTWARLESGSPSVTLATIAAATDAVGLDLVCQTYPGGGPSLRDTRAARDRTAACGDRESTLASQPGGVSRRSPRGGGPGLHKPQRDHRDRDRADARLPGAVSARIAEERLARSAHRPAGSARDRRRGHARESIRNGASSCADRGRPPERLARAHSVSPDRRAARRRRPVLDTAITYRIDPPIDRTVLHTTGPCGEDLTDR